MSMPHATQLERPAHNSVTENEFFLKLRLAAELQKHGLLANHGLSCEYCEGGRRAARSCATFS